VSGGLNADTTARVRPVRVTFTGFERFWMQALVDGLSSRHSDVLDCSWALWPSTWQERVRFARAMLRSDVVVRVGMPFEFESETNRFWLRWVLHSRRIQGVNYWIGNDSWSYMRRAGAQRTEDEHRAIRGLTHFAATENIAAALGKSGVPAETVYFPSPDQDVPVEPPPYPARFGVLSYWRDQGWEYSSGPEIMAAARRLPDVDFDVVGATGAGISDVPKNLRFHGRVSRMTLMYSRSVVLVRMVQWDAVPGAMVEEALLYARQAIYSFVFPHTTFVAHRDEEGLVAELSRLRDAFVRGELGLNLEGRAFMLESWRPDAHWAYMCGRLLAIARHPVGDRGASRTQ